MGLLESVAVMTMTCCLVHLFDAQRYGGRKAEGGVRHIYVASYIREARHHFHFDGGQCVISC
jgi:hypothetical protein